MIKNFFSLFGFCFFAALIFSFKPVGTYDVWHHLAIGRWMLEHRGFPDHEIFSYVLSGQPWNHHEWLGDLVFYGAYLFGGFNGLILLQVFVFAFFLYFAARVVQIYCRSSSIPLVFILALSFLTYNRVMSRPHIFADLFVSILLYFFSVYSAKTQEPSQKTFAAGHYLAFAVFFVVWANLHATATALGLALLFLFTAGHLTNFFWGRYKGKTELHFPAGLCRLFLVCALAVLLNPDSYQVYTLPFEQLKMKLIMAESSDVISPFNTEPLRFLANQGYVLVLFLSLLLVPFIFRFQGWPQLAIGFFLAFISIKHLRYTNIFALWALPLMAAFIRQPMTAALQSVGKISRVLVVPVILLFALRGIPQTLKGDFLHIGGGVSQEIDASGGTRFLQGTKVQGRIFNNFDIGSFLDFMGLSPFMDCRTVLYGDRLFYEATRGLFQPEMFESLSKKWSFDVLFFTRTLQGVMLPLHVYLLNNPAWEPVYVDKVVMIYLRKNRGNDAVIDKYHIPRQELLAYFAKRYPPPPKD